MTAQRTAIRAAIDAQAEWMNSHGWTLAGYVARYGSKDDPEHYGDGGEAIFAADSVALEKLIRRGIEMHAFRRAEP